ncbi:hypothetical protein BKA80DRAFT_278901 [Phyllosticta citrichinensis]
MVERPVVGASGGRTGLLGHTSSARHARLRSCHGRDDMAQLHLVRHKRQSKKKSSLSNGVDARAGVIEQANKSVVGRSKGGSRRTGVIPIRRGLPNQDDAGSGWAVAGVRPFFVSWKEPEKERECVRTKESRTCFPRVEELEIPEHHRHPFFPFSTSTQPISALPCHLTSYVSTYLPIPSFHPPSSSLRVIFDLHLLFFPF